jgi:tetratricopeptide (TPR) repeat protein
MAGPHLEKVRASSIAAVEKSYVENPADFEKLAQLADALRHAGRLDDAIALRARLPGTKEAMAATDDEYLGWAVNNVALALDDAGRSEEADQLFALLNEAPMEGGGWRVSMIINRLELLVSKGKFDKAALLLDGAEQSSTKNGSKYAQQLVRRLHYCIASRLGKKEEAAKILPSVLEHAKDAYHATIDGLLCSGEVGKAEEVALDALKDDEDFGEALVRQLQPVMLTSDDPSLWEDSWHELRKRPAIAKEFDRLGRDMPPEFIPPARSKLS